MPIADDETRTRRYYPKPGPVGGSLIRAAIALLRKNGVELPLHSHILCATSGGADSTALAHLLVKYGGRIALSHQIRASFTSTMAGGAGSPTKISALSSGSPDGSGWNA